MKKTFSIAIALLTMASASVFGMYGVDTDWITFLTDGNQFRARLDQLGFTLGNDTIKGTFGFDNDTGFGGVYGNMLNTTNGVHYNFDPTISMGIAYTSSAISVGVGYNATIGNRYTNYNGRANGKKAVAVGHTPVLVLNALDNAFRMAIPIQVVNLTDKTSDGNQVTVTAVSVDSQFRYYTGLDILPQIRLYLRYGNYSYQNKPSQGSQVEITNRKIAESFGFDFRLYFGSVVEEVSLQPILKIQYNGALGRQHNRTRVQAIGALDNAAKIINTYTNDYAGSNYMAKGVYSLNILPTLGLTANSDIVSLYLEPSLGLRVTGGGDNRNAKEKFSLGYGVYGEITVTPHQNLEWYFEAEIGNLKFGEGDTTYESENYLGFNAQTGITWYLPRL